MRQITIGFSDEVLLGRLTAALEKAFDAVCEVGQGQSLNGIPLGMVVVHVDARKVDV